MDFISDIPNPLITILLAIIISYAVIKSKRYRKISIPAFIGMIYCVFIGANFSKAELFEHSLALWTSTISFMVFAIGTMAWLILDMIATRTAQRQHKAS